MTCVHSSHTAFRDGCRVSQITVYLLETIHNIIILTNRTYRLLKFEQKTCWALAAHVCKSVITKIFSVGKSPIRAGIYRVRFVTGFEIFTVFLNPSLIFTL